MKNKYSAATGRLSCHDSFLFIQKPTVDTYVIEGDKSGKSDFQSGSHHADFFDDDYGIYFSENRFNGRGFCQ